MTNQAPFLARLGHLLPHNDLKSSIAVPMYCTAATTLRSGAPSAQALALSHILQEPSSDPGDAFMVCYTSKSAPILTAIKSRNVAELIVQAPMGLDGDVPQKSSRMMGLIGGGTASAQMTQIIWRLEGRFYVACAPQLLMRFPPPRVGSIDGPNSDPRLFWEKERLRVFMRLAPSHRAMFLLPPSGDPLPASISVTEIADCFESVNELADRLLSSTSLVAPLSGSQASGDSNTAPFVNVSRRVSTGNGSSLPADGQFELSSENFVLLVFKISKADLLEHGPHVADYRRTVWTLESNSTWSEQSGCP